ncbi:MAG: kinase/pyrophosphorylase [Deltaproteobacteria bacterium]|nr:kinase/pyrophosphorylase [Deltaproteobacteria bacterium]
MSDGTGDTAATAVTAAMLQFQVEWDLRTFGEIRHEPEIRRIAAEAEQAGAMIVFTLVDEEIARAMVGEAAKRSVPVVDLLGPVLAKIAEVLRARPRSQPGLLHAVSDDYFRRIEAVEFAVRHDDGANVAGLLGADIVLVGISRSSKTPLSMYLAQRGYKVGNVPIVPGVEPPRELVELDPNKVFGLTIDPETMLTVRQERIRSLGVPHSDYVDMDSVRVETRRARRLFQRYGWRVVDASGRAVEENAARILHLMDADRGRR